MLWTPYRYVVRLGWMKEFLVSKRWAWTGERPQDPTTAAGSACGLRDVPGAGCSDLPCSAEARSPHHVTEAIHHP